MALTKDKKHEVVEQVGKLLDESKMTVVAAYTGTSVQSLQQLRRQARQGGTDVKVIKNRLVAKALAENDKFKETDTAALKGQLLYAFNSQDEVAAAQALADFAKTNPSIVFAGAINADGLFLGADDVKALAGLPSKDQLRSMLVGTLSAPLSGFVSVMAGNVRGVLNVLSARADALGE